MNIISASLSIDNNVLSCLFAYAYPLIQNTKSYFLTLFLFFFLCQNTKALKSVKEFGINALILYTLDNTQDLIDHVRKIDSSLLVTFELRFVPVVWFMFKCLLKTTQCSQSQSLLPLKSKCLSKAI